MVLSALLTPIVVPPANFAVLALLALWRRRTGTAAVVLCVLVLLGMPPVADALTDALERDVAATSLADAQAVLILGGDIDRDRDGKAVPGPLTLERLREGAALARSSGLPLAVTGGPAWRGGPAIGAVMADSLRRDFAVSPRWIETRSADTWENARNSAALLALDGIHDVVVVSQAWHLRRALLAFRRSGLTAAPAAVWRTGYPGQGLTPAGLAGALLPRAGTWERSYLALHEWIGVVWYVLRDLAWP